MKNRDFIALMLVFGLMIAKTSVVLAVPPRPSSFYGTVKVGGTNAPTETIISAWVNGVKYAEQPVFVAGGNTVYTLDVPGEDQSTSAIEGGREGDTIVFYIGGLVADQTGHWHEGTHVLLDLSRSKLTLQVMPDTLLVNSGATASISAALLDGAGSPISGTLLSGGTSPSTLGMVNLLTATNLAGEASGTWAAGTLGGAGSLSVGNGRVTATVPITLSNPVPAIEALNPTTTTVGGPAFTLVVNGVNFVSNSTVRWNGSDRETRFVNSGQLTSTITANNVSASGVFSVTVFNPTPGGGTSNRLGFLAVNPPASGDHFVYLPVILRNFRSLLSVVVEQESQDQ